MGKFSFLFLGANSPWTYGMAEALAQFHHTHAVEFYDWRIYNLLRPTWSSRTPPPLLQRSMQILPTGYARRLEKLFRFYLQQRIQSWCRQLQSVSGSSPWVITCHPYLTYWVRRVPQERLIYYNFDDYVLYRPELAKLILKQEQELIERATITLCAAYFQAITLQKRHPHRESSIHHYPHGVVDTYINTQSANSPEAMTVGYVGNLGDRLDWQLVYQVIQACPEITFIFVGSLDNQTMFDQQDWQVTRTAVLSLPNVRHVPKVPPDQVAKYYWSFAVNWIPYIADHPFNLAACPTKIMDGIASGRSILSTDIPECRLYPQWLTIFHSPKEAIALIRKQLILSDKPEACNKTSKQIEFARKNTWQARAQTLENLLS